MPEIPKEKPTTEKRINVVDKTDSWAEDQKTRDYYYDDSHGYQVYDPENDDDEESEDK
ncbi:MAG: hypothetical protein QM785_11795 [Pyrinomonadaceae bacterium]